ncbi:MAG: SPOR domain-containing protein [Nitrospirae bacterium]|nr:SPOR domain-containing protein [Nitrospirota bacterium]
MTDKENPFDRKEDKDRDLFTDESDIFGEELNKSGDRGKAQQEEYEEDSFPEDDVDRSYEEEKPASPVRRILLIAASIVVGIGLGVGGYFFFTAGSKQAPAEKQIVKTLPEPALVPAPVPAAIPSEKPNVIPEIPVRTEPLKTETAQAKDAKPQESLPKPEARKEPVQKPEAEKSKKTAASAAAVKPEEKKLLSPKPAVNKEDLAAPKGKGAYYVQAGLFENEKNAKAVAQKIRQKGFTPVIRKVADAQNRTLYRVTVGSYSSHKKAVEGSDALGKQGVKAIVRKQ